mgnify:CR=1 FL=1
MTSISAFNAPALFIACRITSRSCGVAPIALSAFTTSLNCTPAGMATRALYAVNASARAAESAAFRLARLDLERFGSSAEGVVKGDLAKRHVYYTNSTFLNISEAMNPIERVRLEGKYHDLIEAGADAVFVAGCLEGECHYLQGNIRAKKRVNKVKKDFRPHN